MLLVPKHRRSIRHTGVAVLFATMVFYTIPHACAAILLDDFDEAFEIMLPYNEQYIMQTGVGPLGVERWSNVVATSASQPTGRVDADLSRPSALTVVIDRVNPLRRPPAIGINLLYFFNEMDVTQGGANDRVVVDFAYLHSDIPLRRVTVFVQDASQSGVSYGTEIFDLPQQDQPFSLEFPFASFGTRGGGAGEIDYHRVYRLSLGISPTRFDNIDQINFSTAIQRVRITGAIPEPRTSVVALVSLCCGASLSTRIRRKSHDQ